MATELQRTIEDEGSPCIGRAAWFTNHECCVATQTGDASRLPVSARLGQTETVPKRGNSGLLVSLCARLARLLPLHRFRLP